MNHHWQGHRGHHSQRHPFWQTNTYPSQPQPQPQPQQFQPQPQPQPQQFQPQAPQPGIQQQWPNQQGWSNEQEWDRRISIYDAMAAANDQVPGDIVKVELEREQGVLVYEVEIVTAEGVKYEIDVDVNTGEVLNVQLD